MKHFFVLNPAAGKGRAEVDILPVIRAAAKATKIDYEIHRTLNVGEATTYVKNQIVKYPDEVLRFYAIGGDGTINEVANGMVGAPRTELAVLPCGSGDDFAKMIGPKSIMLDLYMQITGDTKPVDIIRINDQYCMNMINIGIDGSTVAGQKHIKETTPFGGKPSYIIAVVKELARNTSAILDITLEDGRHFSGDYTLCCVANGSFCGGGFKSAPKAHINDGYLDVSIVKKVDRKTFVQFVLPYHNGTHLDNKKIAKKDLITYVQCKSLILKNPNRMPVSIDGELAYFEEMEIENIHNALQVVVPAGCSID